MKAPESEREPLTDVAEYTINDLPDEVIEFVLSFVPPYKDLHECMQVCRRWRTSVLNVVWLKRRKFLRALSETEVQWERSEGSPGDGAPTIAKRYSHSAAVHDNSMYVFGGCTNSMTTFNDLWRLDLSRRQWVRPLASGSYPTPKACSSLVCHGDTLVLFGGWAYPCSYPFHQSYQLFNELHTYSITDNRWSCAKPASDGPPPMAGHSVSVHGRLMVLFGGMQRADATGPLVKTNSVWALELDTLRWRQIETTSPRPRERYGHAQIALDAEHALIVGGCGGPNGLYSDMWLLGMRGAVWTWRRVEVRRPAFAPPDLWCHPVCRVGPYAAVLNRPRHVQQPVLQPRVRQPPPKAAPPPEAAPPPAAPPPMPERMAAFSTGPQQRPPRAAAARNRQRQLELLLRMENSIRDRREGAAAQPAPGATPQARRKGALSLYLLDLRGALEPEPWVAWRRPGTTPQRSAPEETLLYTLVHGKAELVMFGGIQKDNNGHHMLLGNLDTTAGSAKVSNSLHFISAPVDVI